jgi:hypothetical protein
MPRIRNAFDAGYDFATRPDTYWPETPTEPTVLASIKGTARRKAARARLEDGTPALPADADVIFESALPAEDRATLGHLHPVFLGGEFLPDFEGDEVEIARIDLDSTAADAISVRARHDETGAIRYRVVDEYQEDGWYAIDPKRSSQPLTLGELIDLIDSTRHIAAADEGDADELRIGLTDAFRYFDPDDDPAAVISFVTVSSTHYPQLGRYYHERGRAWYAQRARKAA